MILELTPCKGFYGYIVRNDNFFIKSSNPLELTTDKNNAKVFWSKTEAEMIRETVRKNYSI